MFSLVRRLRSRAGYELHLLRTRHTHWVVQSRDGKAGFGMFGDARAAAHFARHYLGDGEARSIRRGYHGFDFTRRAHALADEFGLAVLGRITAPRALAPDLLTLPSLIGLRLALPDSLEAFVRGLTSSAKSDMARVRIAGFRHEISRDPSLVPEFQQRFHEPSMRSRHGDDGYIFSTESLRESMTRDGAELLRIFRGDEWVAGLIAKAESDGYRMLRIGWRDGSRELLKGGVLGALYWGSVQRAYELRLPNVLTGASAPYLEDGLFYYKTKWGARLDRPESKYESWQLLLKPAHPACRKFLEARSLIVPDAGQGFVVLSHCDPEAIKGIDIHRDRISAWYRLQAERGSISVSDQLSEPILPASLAGWYTRP